MPSIDLSKVTRYEVYRDHSRDNGDTLFLPSLKLRMHFNNLRDAQACSKSIGPFDDDQYRGNIAPALDDNTYGTVAHVLIKDMAIKSFLQRAAGQELTLTCNTLLTREDFLDENFIDRNRITIDSNNLNQFTYTPPHTVANSTAITQNEEHEHVMLDPLIDTTSSSPTTTTPNSQIMRPKL